MLVWSSKALEYHHFVPRRCSITVNKFAERFF